MQNPKARSEILSFTQHVELNKAGWWDKTTETLVLAYLWIADQPYSIEEIVNGIKADFAASLDSERVLMQVNYLIDDKKILQINDNQYKISDIQKQQMDKTHQNSLLQDQEVKNNFIAKLVERGIDDRINELWNEFNTKFLLPLIQDMGAKMYELFTGKNIELNDLSSFHSFLERYSIEQRPQIREAIVAFFDPTDPTVRRYVIQYLNAIFLLEASNLSETSVQTFSRIMGKSPVFKIFVDTNFLFYLLDLDDSGFKEASNLLKHTIDELTSKANIKLYVLPVTIREARDTLSYEAEDLMSIRATQRLSRAVLLSGHVSGLRENFFHFKQI